MRERRPELYGHVVENFVASELRKLLSFSGIRAELRYFRTDSGEEVDFVLERPDGSLAGIEVKRSDRVNSDDFKGLETLRDITKDDFICGVVLYAGKQRSFLRRGTSGGPTLRTLAVKLSPTHGNMRVKREQGLSGALSGA